MVSDETADTVSGCDTFYDTCRYMLIHVSGILVKHARRVDTCVSLRVSVRIGGYHSCIRRVSSVIDTNSDTGWIR